MAISFGAFLYCRCFTLVFCFSIDKCSYEWWYIYWWWWFWWLPEHHQKISHYAQTKKTKEEISQKITSSSIVVVQTKKLVIPYTMMIMIINWAMRARFSWTEKWCNGELIHGVGGDVHHIGHSPTNTHTLIHAYTNSCIHAYWTVIIYIAIFFFMRKVQVQ